MPKKPTKRKVSKSKALVPVTESSRKSVNITKANNGFVVSSYTDKGEITIIAKTKKEAKKASDKLLGF